MALIYMDIAKKFSRIAKRIKKQFKRINPPHDLWLAVKSAAILLFIAAIILEYFESRPETPADDIGDKVGQMLMVGFRGAQAPPDSYIAKAVNDLNLGGVILFDRDVPSSTAGRNITDYGQTKQLVAQLKSYSVKSTLLVAVDAEGGLINRLKPSLGFIDVPSAKNLGQDPAAAINDYWNLAKELADLGFNVNFAPVVDLDINPENPVIGALERSYSAEPQAVATLARALIAAHKSFGIITSLKHFPGHGSSDSDSHLGLPDITLTWHETELKPYEQLIKDDAADSVMTAHIIDKNIDPDYPATLSPKFIQDILRQRLGFDGVVFSDDMQMGAIVDNYGFEDAIVRAVNAGCDILVFSNNGSVYDETVPYRAKDAILKAVRDGRISRERIDQAYGRIQKLKEKIH